MSLLPEAEAPPQMQVRKRNGGLEPVDVNKIVRAVERCCTGLVRQPFDACIAHGDLAQSNLLDGSRLWLLDWEYAQLSDPLMDVACVLAYYPVAVRHRAELAAAAGLGAQASGEALAQRITIYQGLSWLWHLARGEQAPPP